ncbi:hypothetical protein MCAV_03740 [[Mycoplasma] cavipharyngis]|uniref:hypothetical protein n=1 Tax=[Mycoplasma] cavipharyngis TaxID=92757 RepID=UPI0037040D54
MKSQEQLLLNHDSKNDNLVIKINTETDLWNYDLFFLKKFQNNQTFWVFAFLPFINFVFFCFDYRFYLHKTLLNRNFAINIFYKQLYLIGFFYFLSIVGFILSLWGYFYYYFSDQNQLPPSLSKETLFYLICSLNLFLNCFGFGITIFWFKKNIIKKYQKFTFDQMKIDFRHYSLVSNNQQLAILWAKTNQAPFLSFISKKLIRFSWLDLKFEKFLSFINVNPELVEKFVSKRETKTNWYKQQYLFTEQNDTLRTRRLSIFWIFCSSYAIYFINKYYELNKNSIRLNLIILIIHWIISWTIIILFIYFLYQNLNLLIIARNSVKSDSLELDFRFKLVLIIVIVYFALGLLRHLFYVLLYQSVLKLKKDRSKNNDWYF